VSRFSVINDSVMDFNSFLTNLLKEKKIDVGVYHSYLVGILEDTIDEDEKREMILDIVSSLIVSFSQFFVQREFFSNLSLRSLMLNVW
jgi:hypothetical protein